MVTNDKRLEGYVSATLIRTVAETKYFQTHRADEDDELGSFPRDAETLPGVTRTDSSRRNR